MTVMQKGQGIDNFFLNMFGFLYRKSDYFSDPQNSWSYVENNYKKYQKKFEERKEKEAKKKKKEQTSQPTQSSNSSQSATVKEITPEEYERKKRLEKERKEREDKEEDTDNSSSKETTSITKKEGKGKEGKEEKDENKLKEGTVRPDKGNGGHTDKYRWSQNDIKEISVIIPVPMETKGKDIKCNFDAKNFSLQIRENTPIINGEFDQLIKPDSLLWTLDEEKGEKFIMVTFEKFNNMSWWECFIKGDQPIDTTKINPEASKVSDIEDPEMKAQIEKLMFDTQQKAQGLPGSDELKNRDMMSNFMKAHPEMDFSKAKFG